MRCVSKPRVFMGFCFQVVLILGRAGQSTWRLLRRSPSQVSERQAGSCVAEHSTEVCMGRFLLFTESLEDLISAVEAKPHEFDCWRALLAATDKAVCASNSAPLSNTPGARVPLHVAGRHPSDPSMAQQVPQRLPALLRVLEQSAWRAHGAVPALAQLTTACLSLQLAEAEWRECGEDAGKRASPDEAARKAMEVFERGAAPDAAGHCVELWQKYIGWLQRAMAWQPSDGEGEDEGDGVSVVTQEHLRSAYRRAVQLHAGHPKCVSLWTAWAAWEAGLPREAQGSPHAAGAVFAAALAVAMPYVDDVWAAFVAFARDRSPAELAVSAEELQEVQAAADAEATAAAAKTAAAAAGEEGAEDLPPGDAVAASASPEAVKAALLARRAEARQAALVSCAWRVAHEAGLKGSRGYFHFKPVPEKTLAAWRAFLAAAQAAEGTAHGPSQDTVDALFRRCLVITAAYPEFWGMYAAFLAESPAGGNAAAVSVLQAAASVHCPGSHEVALALSLYSEAVAATTKGDQAAVQAGLAPLDAFVARGADEQARACRSGLFPILQRRATLLLRRGDAEQALQPLDAAMQAARQTVLSLATDAEAPAVNPAKVAQAAADLQFLHLLRARLAVSAAPPGSVVSTTAASRLVEALCSSEVTASLAHAEAAVALTRAAAGGRVLAGAAVYGHLLGHTGPSESSAAPSSAGSDGGGDQGEGEHAEAGCAGTESEPGPLPGLSKGDASVLWSRYLDALQVGGADAATILSAAAASRRWEQLSGCRVGGGEPEALQPTLQQGTSTLPRDQEGRPMYGSGRVGGHKRRSGDAFGRGGPGGGRSGNKRPR